jgi:hypothetical protein
LAFAVAHAAIVALHALLLLLVPNIVLHFVELNFLSHLVLVRPVQTPGYSDFSQISPFGYGYSHDGKGHERPGH